MFTFVTFAIAAIVIGMAATGSVQFAQANHKSGHNVGSGPGTPRGEPYGQAVSEEAQRQGNTLPNGEENEKGFGDDIKSCRQAQCAGFEESDGNNGIGDVRASDEAGKQGKLTGDTRDETAGNPDN